LSAPDAPRGAAAPRPSLDALLVGAAAFAVRLPLALYGAGRFPPADDGAFYHVVAERIARGLGYTWAWPDGAVTYAAHYPVGYPALVGAAYALFGAHAGVAMLLHAAIGGLGAAGAYLFASRTFTRRGALLAGALLALAPGLVLYTPALMTEVVSGTVLVLAAAVATAKRPLPVAARAALGGATLGAGVLMRPELVVLAPLVGLLPSPGLAGRRMRLFAVAAASAACLAVCVPWTLRNCARLEHCAFVSANGGWNLYIGSSPLGGGGWAPIDRIGVPSECREVFGEVEKDRCFGRAGLERIAAHPGAWLGLVPKKLAATFDYGTAATYYLSTSSPERVGERAKAALGAIEIVGQRTLLLIALAALALAPGPRRRARLGVLAFSALLSLSPGQVLHPLLPGVWPAFLGVVALALLFGRALLREPTALVAAGVVAMTALVHSVFFGASRYTLVCLPALAALGGGLLGRAESSGAAFDSRPPAAG